jgi:hypothetical protein
MTLGRYEQVVRDALYRVSEGPWTVRDLTRTGEFITDDLCGVHGLECSGSAVVDWLHSLGPEQQEDLIEEINRERG